MREDHSDSSGADFAGDFLGFRNGTYHVGIEREHDKLVTSHLLDLALRRSVESLERVLATLPFEPSGRVLKQLKHFAEL